MPTVTVIVSAYNQNESLDKHLPLWTAQADRVIVSDDGGKQSAKDVATKHGCDYVWQPDEGFRQSAAFQNGLEHATSDYVQFTDAESMPAPNMIASNLDSWVPRALCLGPRRFLEHGRWVWDERKWEQFDGEKYTYCCGANMFMERDSLNEIGGWCREFVGYGLLDYDVGARWIKSGRHLLYVPGALVSFNVPRTHPPISKHIYDIFASRMEALL